MRKTSVSPSYKTSKYFKYHDFERYKIVMPIHKNLNPILPSDGDDIQNFSCYNPNPVYIQGILPEFSLMNSKEKPKKIGLIGSDDKIYYFVVKQDQGGDMRKEARFIMFANMINTMFESNVYTKDKALKLFTYAIVPLSYKTGLIEWVNETETLKNAISDQWNKFTIKGDLNKMINFIDFNRIAQEK